MSLLVELVLAGPAGQAPDLGAAELESRADLTRADLEAAAGTKWCDGIAT
ncbi:MAG: hypothetical protein K0S78_2786 [Thermomicrobiales bacterium]|jgi:hypothetical protein|nr:hypothetical protein [Thermomicrobiales bacterium]MDF3040267.1 hypothetical protein [Thermomicrobiales bacterium]